MLDPQLVQAYYERCGHVRFSQTCIDAFSEGGQALGRGLRVFVKAWWAFLADPAPWGGCSRLGSMCGLASGTLSSVSPIGMR